MATSAKLIVSMRAGLVRAVKGRPGISLRRWRSYWEVSLFWLNQEMLALTSMAVFKTRRHSPQCDNQDLCRGNPHKTGSEHLSNLRIYRWMIVALGLS